jgi:hypothetical protein
MKFGSWESIIGFYLGWFLATCGFAYFIDKTKRDRIERFIITFILTTIITTIIYIFYYG